MNAKRRCEMEARPAEPTESTEDIFYDRVNYANNLKQTGHFHRPRLQRLKDAKKSLEIKLAEVNKAIELLEANPQMYELMEAIERAGV